MTVHRLGIMPDSFDALLAGALLHDLRRIGDVPFHPGDSVAYTEVDPRTDQPTGRTAEARVTYVTWEENKCALSDSGLAPGFAILSLDGARATLPDKAT